MIRRIISEEEREAKEQRNKKIIVVILGLIMLFSSLSYAFISFQDSGGETATLQTKNFGGVDFTKTEYGSWKFEIQEYSFETQYDPQETLNVSVILTKGIQTYVDKPLYFGIDKVEESTDYGKAEIIQNLNSFIFRYQDSCLTQNCTENYPLKNCTDNNVIIFREAEKSKIFEENSCVIIEYNKDEEIMSADALIFKLLGLRQ